MCQKKPDESRRKEARELESRTGITPKQHSIVLYQALANPEHEERTQRSELQRQIIRTVRRDGVVKE